MAPVTSSADDLFRFPRWATDGPVRWIGRRYRGLDEAGRLVASAMTYVLLWGAAKDRHPADRFDEVALVSIETTFLVLRTAGHRGRVRARAWWVVGGGTLLDMWIEVRVPRVATMEIPPYGRPAIADAVSLAVALIGLDPR
jgi:hypothetical protein